MWFTDFNGNILDMEPGNVQAGTITVGGEFKPSAPSIDGYTAGGGTTADGIDYAWSYGGGMTEEDGTFTITPYQTTGVHYVIDTVVVDGEVQTVTDRTQAMTIDGAERSVFASFAYTVTF